MRSERRSWRQLVGATLLSLLFILSLALLAVTERGYTAFREALQGIGFEIRLTDYEVTAQQARLHWVARVTMPPVKIPAQVELLDWHLRSADESTYLGFYTTRDIQIGLRAGGATEIPLEAVLQGANAEKLQTFRSSAPSETVELLFQGTALVMFRLPKGEVRKKVPVVGIFMLGKDGK